jgi:hypothetical protein
VRVLARVNFNFTPITFYLNVLYTPISISLDNAHRGSQYWSKFYPIICLGFGGLLVHYSLSESGSEIYSGM